MKARIRGVCDGLGRVDDAGGAGKYGNERLSADQSGRFMQAPRAWDGAGVE